MKNKKLLLWSPRVLSILFIMFLSLFAFDVFSGDATLIEKIGGFLIHLIPSYLLIFILLISWKKPLVGGVMFLILSIVFTLYFKTYTAVLNFLIVSFPVAIIGGLFILSHVLSGKNQP